VDEDETQLLCERLCEYMRGWADMQGVNKTTCDSPIVSLFAGSLLCFQAGKGGAANRDFVDSVVLEHISHDAAAAVMPEHVPHVRVACCSTLSSSSTSPTNLFFIDCEARHKLAYVKSGWLYLIGP